MPDSADYPLTDAFRAKMASAAARGHYMRGRTRGNGRWNSPREWSCNCQCGWESAWGSVGDIRKEAEAHADGRD